MVSKPAISRIHSTSRHVYSALLLLLAILASLGFGVQSAYAESEADVTQDGVKYHLWYGSGGASVAVMSYSGSATQVALSDSVSYGGKTYKSSDSANWFFIGPDVFKGNTKITELAIPDDYGGINSDAFAGCTNLKTYLFKGNQVGAEDIKSSGIGTDASGKPIAGVVVWTKEGSNVDKAIQDLNKDRPADKKITLKYDNDPYSKRTKTSTIKIAGVTAANVSYAGGAWPPAKPSLTVKDASGNAVPASGYTATYTYNAGYKKAQAASGSYVGPATVTVKGKGSYTGTANATFYVTTVADATKIAGLTEATVKKIEKIKAGANKVPQANSATMSTFALPKVKQMRVDWKVVTGATNYLVGCKRSTEKDWTYYVTGGKTSYTFSNMKEGNLMEFRVAVYDGKKRARSEWTQINCRFYREMTKLKATVGAGKINLTWGKVSGATGYQVLLGTKGDLSDAEVITISGGSTVKTAIAKFKGKALVKGKTYYLKMRAIKTAKNINNKENTYIGIHTLRRECKITSVATTSSKSGSVFVL